MVYCECAGDQHGVLGSDSHLRPHSEPADLLTVHEDPASVEPPMWLMADACRHLLPEPAEAAQPPTGQPAQPSNNAPPRPPEAALRLAVPGALAAKLRPYQKDGVRFLFRHGARARLRLVHRNTLGCGYADEQHMPDAFRLPCSMHLLPLSGSMLAASAASSRMIWCVVSVLAVMHQCDHRPQDKNSLSGRLPVVPCDQGLGKTIQAIAFMAALLHPASDHLPVSNSETRTGALLNVSSTACLDSRSFPLALTGAVPNRAQVAVGDAVQDVPRS